MLTISILGWLVLISLTISRLGWLPPIVKSVDCSRFSPASTARCASSPYSLTHPKKWCLQILILMSSLWGDTRDDTPPPHSPLPHAPSRRWPPCLAGDTSSGGGRRRPQMVVLAFFISFPPLASSPNHTPLLPSWWWCSFPAADLPLFGANQASPAHRFGLPQTDLVWAVMVSVWVRVVNPTMISR
jgi:hypothetical protein